MMESNILTDQVIPEMLKLLKLINEATLIGGIFNMGYNECTILTNDIWKQRAYGVPKHCFLLATVMEQGKAPKFADDEEIILLRVEGPAKLPTETDLLNVRTDAIREIITDAGREAASKPEKILDVITRNEIQFSGVKAKILGTFYEETVENTKILKFGTDLDNYYSASRYKVYKPYGSSLSLIVNYLEQKRNEQLKTKLIKLGTVRYSSTQRRSHRANNKTFSIPVKINIEDIISMKTAIFGMTRLGKSNTLKILATSTFEYGIENSIKIGQLIFDPTGEYVKINPQDKTALSQLGENYVTIFKYGKCDMPNEKPLQLNFFSESIIEEVWAIIRNHILLEGESHYFKTFAEINVIGPPTMKENPSEFHRAARRRSALYATLIKAGFQPPTNFQNKITARKEVLEAVNETLPPNKRFSAKHGFITLNANSIIIWWDQISKIVEENSSALQYDGKNWVDQELNAILEVYRKRRGRIGYDILAQLRTFHLPDSEKDYLEEVINELIAGKIVLVDISLGNENVLQYVSERIINGILKYASKLFRENKEIPNIQVFIEEAHKLFNRTKFEKPNSTDPYVRLAKEAAKYRIGLIYATQEVTSVDPQVLSNTSNWIITHLNNHKEINELSKYYDFGDFADQIMKSEDVGFARIKMRSGRYIIPVQIDLFSKERIENARKLVKNLIEKSLGK
ncbi:MAG: ATP-binding protein [Candidatus Helarchaeota archaeon]